MEAKKRLFPGTDPSANKAQAARLAAMHGHADALRILLGDPRVERAGGPPELRSDPLARKNSYSVREV